jgi:hypothetical protein
MEVSYIMNFLSFLMISFVNEGYIVLTHDSGLACVLLNSMNNELNITLSLVSPSPMRPTISSTTTDEFFFMLDSGIKKNGAES